MTPDRFTFVADPTWPWSAGGLGVPGFVVVALLLALLTLWTYLGVPGATFQRIVLLCALRLAALVLAFLAMLRPALAHREDIQVPSTLILALDDSQSMTFQDEYDGQSRWEHLLRILDRSASLLHRLNEEHGVNIEYHRFSEEVRSFDPADSQARADGKRSDYGLMMQSLFERYRGVRYLRGLVVLGDGTDNGTRFHPLTLARQWRSLPCPIHTFAFGKPTTSEQEADVAVTGITTEPAPVVPVKGKLTVRVTVDAPGFANRKAALHLLLDDKEVEILLPGGKTAAFQEEILNLTHGNELTLVCSAPDRPGEVKVTVKIDPLVSETTAHNNEISTYVTVSKEGISMLLIDKARQEPVFITHALSGDPRIRLFDVTFRNSRETPESGEDLYHFSDRHYDVIVIGDVTPGQLTAGDPKVFRTITDLVHDKGTGLLMMGGLRAFGDGGWQGTELAKLMPVSMEPAGQVDGPVKIVLTEAGRSHFVLRLADDPAANVARWASLVPLKGMTRLGQVKPNIDGAVLAESTAGDPVLVARIVGAGRTMAFGGDTTLYWIRPPDGHQLHARFWKQLVLWLAKQEEAEGNVWVKPDLRRLLAGNPLGFTVGVRGKGDVDLKDGRFEVTVIDPGQGKTPVQTVRNEEKEESRGTVLSTNLPGEYRLVVKGTARDKDEQTISGEASARFLVTQEDVEMARRAADHESLRRLAGQGGGTFHQGTEEEFATFLHELESQPMSQVRPRVDLWPDWQRRSTLGGFLPSLLLVFVGLIALEWFLRRRWGLV